MLRERVSDNVYWFQSEVYAQVTAGTIVGPQWAVLIDTLMPSETPLIRNFIESQLMVPVKYIINTHHHADHSWGNCIFPNATIIGHQQCRDLMLEKSTSALAEAVKENSLFRDICISEATPDFLDSWSFGGQHFCSAWGWTDFICRGCLHARTIFCRWWAW